MPESKKYLKLLKQEQCCGQKMEIIEKAQTLFPYLNLDIAVCKKCGYCIRVEKEMLDEEVVENTLGLDEGSINFT